jgi:hypothetical protein
VIFQKFFEILELRAKVADAFKHVNGSCMYGLHRIFLLLIVHRLLGYSRLRDLTWYSEDPMVKRLLGLKRMPEVSTVSRALKSVDEQSYDNLRGLNRDLVVNRIATLTRITLDFDGSVFGTNRAAEGTAVGYNKKKKGQRSYYPLFCTITQTGQVFDVHHRSGNVHDSNGALDFVWACLETARKMCPQAVIEVRMDSAFFSEDMLALLKAMKVEFTISVPFERLVELKKQIEGRSRWQRIDDTWSCFEDSWKPKSWEQPERFIFIRQKAKRQNKEVIQLDLFVPHEYGFDFKVIVTNKTSSAHNVLQFHNGRGSQEKILGELKDQIDMDYVPVRSLAGNQVFLMSAIIAHNLTRELQMRVHDPARGTTFKRAACWIFEGLGTFRMKFIQRAGRLTQPAGKLTLTLSAQPRLQREFRDYVRHLDAAAA